MSDLPDLSALSLGEECTCVIVDLETTGLGKTQNIGITEVGAVKIVFQDTWNKTDEMQIYVQPKEGCITSNSDAVPHSAAFVASQGAVPFESLARTKLAQFCKDADYLLAHNGKRYDFRILHFHEFAPKFAKACDTILAFKSSWTKQQSYSIKALYTTAFRCPVPAAHNAVLELDSGEFPDLIGAALGRVKPVLDAHRRTYG
mgnify:CR=1 FL=1